MHDAIRDHYERHPYPAYSLLATVRPWDTYHLNLDALWTRFNGTPLPERGRILLAGCGSFSPYPTSIANPSAAITALDLSTRSLRRARLHALLHGCRNIAYLAGDLADPSVAPGPYHFIDSFGVIHHLADPLAGLRALERRLSPGGLLRLMVYSRGARREAEAIRFAMRFLKVRDVATLKRLVRRARPGSRFARYLEDSSEVGFDAGLADAFLHPHAVTYRIAELMALIGRTGLTPLRFVHHGALPEIGAETARLEALERDRSAMPNFIVYLGKDAAGGCPLTGDAVLRLNPSLASCVGLRQLRQVAVAPRLGQENPLLDWAARRLLRRFRRPVRYGELDAAERTAVAPFLEALFLTAGDC